jgi:hypothetical protein
LTVLATFLFLFGLACVNYTKPDRLEHHRAVAEQQGLPPPSPAIRYAGAACVVCGAGLLVFVLGGLVKEGERDEPDHAP